MSDAVDFAADCGRVGGQVLLAAGSRRGDGAGGAADWCGRAPGSCGVGAARCGITQWSSGWATKTREQIATRPKSSGRQVAGGDAQCGGQPGGPDNSASPTVTEGFGDRCRCGRGVRDYVNPG